MATLFTPQNAPRDLKSLQEMSNSTLYRLALQINLFKDNESNEQAFIALPVTEKAEQVHRQLLFLDQNPQAASGTAMTMTLPSHQPQYTEQDHMNQPPFPGAPPAPPGFAPTQQQLPYGAPPGYGAPPAPPGFAPPQQQQFAAPPAPGGFAPPGPPGGFAPPQPPGFAPPPSPGGFAPPVAPPQAPGGFAPPPGAPNFAPPQAQPAPGGWAPPGMPTAPGGFTPPPAPPGPTQPGAHMGAPPPAFTPPGAPPSFQPPGGFAPGATPMTAPPSAPPPQRSPSTPTDPNNQGTAAGQLLEAIQALTSQMQRQNELLGGLLTLGENGFITSVLLAERMQIPRQQLSQLLASERDAIRHLTQGKA